MLWSAKAQELLRRQNAPVGTAGLQTLLASLVAAVRSRVSPLLAPVNSLDDSKLVSFHVLSESAIRVDERHTWHMETIAKLYEADEQRRL
jgi:hypothetical protein